MKRRLYVASGSLFSEGKIPFRMPASSTYTGRFLPFSAELLRPENEFPFLQRCVYVRDAFPSWRAKGPKRRFLLLLILVEVPKELNAPENRLPRQ